MTLTISASELRAGDYISAPEGAVYFYRVPTDKTEQFTAYYCNRNDSGQVTYEPDETVQLLCRWPRLP